MGAEKRPGEGTVRKQPSAKQEQPQETANLLTP